MSMEDLAKVYDRMLDFENEILFQIELLGKVRLNVYKNKDKEELKDIFSVLSCILYDIEKYREWVKEQLN